MLKQSREQGAGLSRVEREVTVSAFCRRRLAVLMVRSGMVENVKAVRVSFFNPLGMGWVWSKLGCGPGPPWTFSFPLIWERYFCAVLTGFLG